MAFSIEARVPFLDYRLVEYVFGLPNDLKLRQGYTKAILRDAMLGIVPTTVLRRTDKMGFVTPEDLWFRGPLQGYVREILTSGSFKTRGYVNAPRALQLFDKHCAGDINISQAIWRWINLELWSQQFIDRNPFIS